MKAFTFVVLLSLANFALAVPVADKTSDGTLIEAASGKKSVFQNVDYADYYNSLPAVSDKCYYTFLYYFSNR